MNPITLLVNEANLTFEDLLATIEPVDEPLSWAVVPMKEGEYLNTNGSILTMIQHVAGCKLMYASAAFTGGEIRWRECAERYEAIGSNWAKSVEDLKEAHQYWMASWANLTPDQLEDERENIRGKLRPAWKLIQIVTNHDMYHSGQIEVLKVSLGPSTVPPPSSAEDIRQYCRELPLW